MSVIPFVILVYVVVKSYHELQTFKSAFLSWTGEEGYMTNGKREDFYRVRAKEIADFLKATNSIKENPYVERILKDPHQIVDVILSKLQVGTEYQQIKGIQKKYLKADFISNAAVAAIKRRKPKIPLVYEHLVPKKSEIFEKLKELATTMPSDLEDKIFQLLMDYYFVATITKEEDKNRLAKNLKKAMPENWDKKDPFARYKAAGLYDELSETGLFEDRILND